MTRVSACSRMRCGLYERTVRCACIDSSQCCNSDSARRARSVTVRVPGASGCMDGTIAGTIARASGQAESAPLLCPGKGHIAQADSEVKNI